ncbi:hypothetical protein [Zavarzinella formosa]|uniref:hypothetical protein n=1 Tax=Zavarzinella formosa TaxID=360055 RepID=UPI00031C7513|nr:hypothetical protein [Zavarzinella formosa]
MFRTGLKIGTAACGLALLAPAIASAYFPPPPTVTTTAVPPDPFVPPTAGGVGEPEPPSPTGGPTVSTPEPASFVSAATALVLLGAYGLYRRRQATLSTDLG